MELVKLVREQSGAGIMACRKALIKAGGDTEKALELLGQQGRLIALPLVQYPLRFPPQAYRSTERYRL